MKEEIQVNEKLKYRLDICLIHFALYFVILIVPWMFSFEMLPIPYGELSVLAEAGLYVLWSLILILSVIQVKRDIEKYTFDMDSETVSKRMWKVIFIIMRVLMLITLAYLVLCLLLIGISYLV